MVYGIALVLMCSLAVTLKAQNIYVTIGNGTLGEYTTSGATVNASLISGLGYPGAPGLDGVAVSGNNLFLANYAGGGPGAGFVGEYTTSGGTVNASLITGLTAAYSIAIFGSYLFVVNEGVGQGNGTVGEYTTSGATIATTLISGLDVPSSIAISGNDLFVANAANGVVGEYTTSGATVNASLISGLSDPQGLAISGNNLFVTSGDTIGEYTLSGAIVNASLISGLSYPEDIAISGNELFVVNNGGGGYIGEYTLSGATVNASLVSGIGGGTYGIAISPEPSAGVLTGLGTAGLWLWRRRNSSGLHWREL